MSCSGLCIVFSFAFHSHHKFLFSFILVSGFNFMVIYKQDQNLDDLLFSRYPRLLFSPWRGGIVLHLCTIFAFFGCLCFGNTWAASLMKIETCLISSSRSSTVAYALPMISAKLCHAYQQLSRYCAVSESTKM